MVQSPEGGGFGQEDDSWFSHDAAGKRLQWIVSDVLFKCPESHFKSHFGFGGVTVCCDVEQRSDVRLCER